MISIVKSLGAVLGASLMEEVTGNTPGIRNKMRGISAKYSSGANITNNYMKSPSSNWMDDRAKSRGRNDIRVQKDISNRATRQTVVDPTTRTWRLNNVISSAKPATFANASTRNQTL